MPWNLSSVSDASRNAGVSSSSSSLMSPRRWLLVALTVSFPDWSSRDERSARFDKYVRLRRINRCRQQRAQGRGRGQERPRQRGRLATEAAGAEDVVDRSPPGKADVARRRSTHGQGSLAHENADRSVAIPLPMRPITWSWTPSADTEGADDCARCMRAARHFRLAAQRCNGLGSGPLPPPYTSKVEAHDRS